MTIPNIISLIRILLVPIFIIVFWHNSGDIKWSMFIFLIAGFSDVLDGYLARKLNAVSKLGKVLDPVADKLMLITALVSLFFIKRMPLWIVVLVIIKEVVLILGGTFLIIKKRRDLAANIFGKIGTVTLFLAIISQGFLLPFHNLFTVLSGLFAVVALINYVFLHLHYQP